MSASGGSGTKVYSKDGGTNYQSSNVFDSLGGGTYSIKVKDGGNCTSSSSSVLGKNIVSASIYNNSVSCYGGNDGDITLASIIGGNGGQYQFKFSSGNWTNFSTPVTFGTKTAGNYTLQVRDSELCSRSYTVTVTQPTNLVASVAVTHPTCNSSTDGQIVISSTGGSGSKLYSINGVNYYASGTFTSLSNGSGTAYVKDSNLCVDTQSYSLSKSLPQASIVTTNPSCNGGKGSITVGTPSGGNSGTYSFRLGTASWLTTFPHTV